MVWLANADAENSIVAAALEVTLPRRISRVPVPLTRKVSPNLGRKSCKLGPIYCIVHIRCITMHYHIVTSDDEGKDVIVCGLSENSL